MEPRLAHRGLSDQDMHEQRETRIDQRLAQLRGRLVWLTDLVLGLAPQLLEHDVPLELGGWLRHAQARPTLPEIDVECHERDPLALLACRRLISRNLTTAPPRRSPFKMFKFGKSQLEGTRGVTTCQVTGELHDWTDCEIEDFSPA